MIVKLLTAHHLEFLSLKVGCTGSSDPKLVKMPHCWKSHVTALIYFDESKCCLCTSLEDEFNFRFECKLHADLRQTSIPKY